MFLPYRPNLRHPRSPTCPPRPRPRPRPRQRPGLGGAEDFFLRKLAGRASRASSGAVEMGSRGAALAMHATRFNKSLLQYLACPLSKQPLRYCEKSEELVSDTIGVAFPIIDGIPCLVPMRGRVLDSSRDEPSSAK